MIKVFTQNDLVRYLYRETSETETREIDKALLSDTELQLQFKELSAQKRQLDGILIDPSDNSVENILKYARTMRQVM